MKIGKIIMLSFVILSLVVAFTGCGAPSNDITEAPETTQALVTSNPTDAPDEDEAQESEPIEEPSFFPLDKEVTFRLVTMQQDTVDDYNDFYYWQHLEEMTNVHIEFMMYPSREMEQHINLLITSGDYPDMIAQLQSVWAGGLAQAIEEEVAIDLAPYLDEYMPNYKKVIESEPSYAIGAYCDLDNTMIGQAALFYTTDRSGNMGFVTRGDYLDKFGLDYHDITTYDEWYDYLTKVKVELGVEAPMTLKSYGNSNNGAFSGGYGVSTVCFMSMDTPFTVQDGVIHFSPFDEDNFLAYLDMAQKWYSEGLIFKDYMSNMDLYSALQVEHGVCLFDDYVYNMTAYNSIIEDEDYYLVPLSNPVIEEGGESYLGVANDIATGEGISVTTGCTDIETCMRWLDWFYSDEGHIYANYGVEGLSYNIVDGEYILTDVVVNDPNSRGYLMYTMPSKFSFVEIYDRQFSSYTEYQKDTLTLWKTTNRYSIPAAVSMNMDESTEFTTLWGDIGTLTLEFVNLYITGHYGRDDYAQYCETVESMNIEKCIEIKQAAYDRYAAKYGF